MSRERKIWKRWAINPNHNVLEQFHEITNDINQRKDMLDTELLCNITVWRKMYLECGGGLQHYTLYAPTKGTQKLTFMGFTLDFDGSVKEEEVIATWTPPNGLNRIVRYFLDRRHK